MRPGRLLNRSASLVLALLLVVGGTNAPLQASACPASITATGFDDLRGLSDEAVAAIECVVHHGVSTGTSEVKFSPFSEVTRWQMALFLEREMDAARVGLPLVTASPFVDVEGLSAETRLAIDRLTAAGLVNGTSPTTFEPFTSVPRWQMALFLERLLTAAGAQSIVGENRFSDLTGVPAEAVDAIAALDAIGIVRGSGQTTFDPFRAVSRWEMAIFLARVLEYVGADPVVLGIELSRESATYVGGVVGTIHVTAPNGDPYPGVLVDVFVADSIASDGSCRLDVDASVNGGDAGTSTDCTIDIGDPRSGSDGRITIGLAHGPVAETDSIYLWAGEPGQVFDADVVTTWATADLAWLAAPSELTVSGPSTAVFGDVAAFTVALVGGGADEPLRAEVTRNGTTVVTRALTTGSGGTAGFSYAGPSDPSAGDDSPIDDTVAVFWDRNGNGVYDGPAEFRATSVISWDDVP